MKKLLTIAAITLVVGAASAVTMDWGTAAAIKFNGSNLKSDAGVTGYLVAATALSTYAVDASFDASKVGTVLSDKNKTGATSKISGTWYNIDTDTYGNGDSFAVLLKYVTKEDNKDVTYWNLTSGLKTMSGLVVEPPTSPSALSYEFNYGFGTDPTLTSGGGWVKAKASTPVVPEPATGALALAGVALLFRRRKA